MSQTQPDFIRAHRHCARNREEIARSELCGCFHCLAIFPPREVTLYMREAEEEDDNAGSTARCPRCPVDAVLGSASGFPITPAFLRRMQRYWFAGTQRSARIAQTLEGDPRATGAYTVALDSVSRWRQRPFDPLDDHRGVTVTFADGIPWRAIFYSYANIAREAERNRTSGENLHGRFFWEPDMILVDEVSRERIEEVVAHLIATGEFAAIFQRAEQTSAEG
ncbi:MAG TPA: hypothetical protein VIL85_22010 [Thermomicrobiales bacterium]|jgi:hypothetical protein